MELECSSLLSALESAKSTVRALHRGVERDIPAALKAASKLLDTPDDADASHILNSLDQMERLLQNADDKFSASCVHIGHRINEVQARMQLVASDAQACDRTSEDSRLLRYIIDYLLREGHIDIAQQIAGDAGLQPFCDSSLHQMLASVSVALRRQHDCSEALTFCAEHRASLAKISSTLEVELRVQQLVLLIRDCNYPAAIQFARAKLAPFLASAPHLVQQAMMLLALRSDTTIDPYRRFFSEARWAFLDDMFASDACRVLKVASFSALQSATLLGLTAAKTCVCGTADFAESDCPACLPLFSSLLHSLPQAPRQRTVLLCPLQRCVMDDVNPPLALPSGCVISTTAAEQMLRSLGHIECPVSGQICSMSELKRCYIS